MNGLVFDQNLQLGNNLLVQDGCKNCEDSERKDTHQDSFAHGWKACNIEHTEWNEDQTEIRTDIKNHLNDGIMLVCRTLFILNRNCPVLFKWTADTNVVNKHDYNVANNNVTHEDFECHLHFWKIATWEELTLEVC